MKKWEKNDRNNKGITITSNLSENPKFHIILIKNTQTAIK